MIKIFFDTETTGTNHKQHSIIQLSGLIEIDGEIVEAFDYNVKPHPKAKIEDAALHVNGKTIEEIMEYPEMKEIHSKFTKLLSKYINKYDKTDKAWLIGFNNRAFDDFFLRMFFELCGDRFIGSWFWVDTIDVLCLASQYLLNRRASMPSFKLKRVAKELGIVVEEEKLHDSMYDVELTREIYRIVTRLEIEPNETNFYYYSHPESDSVWKQYEPMKHEGDGLTQEIDYKQYRLILNELGLKDGPEMILDELF